MKGSRNGRVLFLLLAFAAALRAEEWITVGPRALGMGGAGVATTRGPLATYWNPANLALPFRPRSDDGDMVGGSRPVSLSVGAHGDVIRTIDKIYNDVMDIDWQDLEDSILNGTDQFNDPAHVDSLQALLRVVTEDIPALDKPGQGLTANVGAELDFIFRNFAVSVRATGWSAARPIVDLSPSSLAFGQDMDSVVGSGQDRTGQLSPEGQALADSLASSYAGVTQNQAEEFVYQAEQAGVDTGDPTVQTMLERIVEGTTSGGVTDENFISNNDSGFSTKALGVTEVGVTYAHSFFDGLLSVGATAKAMYGVTFSKPFTLQDLESGDDILSTLNDKKNREESVRFGVDVGATVRPFDFLAVGIVGRNLNQPKFDAPGEDYELDPQVRVGAAFFPLDWLTVACDADVLKNSSEALPGFKSQTVGGGVEIAVTRILYLRGGISKNVVTSEGLTYHLGLGIYAGPFRLDLAGAASADTTRIEYDDNAARLPDRSSLALMLELVWDL